MSEVERVGVGDEMEGEAVTRLQKSSRGLGRGPLVHDPFEHLRVGTEVLEVEVAVDLDLDQMKLELLHAHSPIYSNKQKTRLELKRQDKE